MSVPLSRSAPPPWPVTRRPGYLIRRLHQIHVALFTQICGRFNITPVQYSLLSALAARGEADQTVLAADVALDRTTTAGALRRLEVNRLVQRSVAASDRRARVCICTEAGVALLRAMENSARLAHEETVAPLDTQDRQIFERLLQRLVAAHARA